MAEEKQTLSERLQEPFEPSEVKWKPQAVKGNRALAIGYVDARVVQDRLDEVFGPEGWQDHYTVIANGSVVCTLKTFIGGFWIEKSDIGSQSDQPDEGDRLKSAFSDALKRASVKLGIGRYLYRLPSQWVDFDPVKKQLVKTPSLPAWAMPRVAGKSNGGIEYVTLEDWGKVRAVCTKRGLSQMAILEHFRISRVGELPKSKLEEAIKTAETLPIPEHGDE